LTSQILTVLGWVLAPVCSALITYIVTKRKTDKAHEEAMRKGMMTLLRQQIIDYHREYVQSGRGCPETIKEQATSIHEAYAALGGNGLGTQLWREIMEAHVTHI